MFKKNYIFFSYVTVLTCLSITYCAAQNVNLEDIWLNYKYYDRGFDRIEWAKSDSSMFFLENHEEGYSYIISQNTLTGAVEDTVFGKHSDPHILFSDFQFSPDNQLLLLETEFESLYRRSGKAAYLLYSVESKTVDTLFHDAKQFNPEFSPNSKFVAFTARNNIYCYNIESKKSAQLTSDGKWNFILNGRTDWVYEEEFEFTKAYEWTLDSKNIIYLQFDESDVKEYQMQVWGDSLYPKLETFKYPKAGEKNSEVSLKLVNVSTGDNLTLLNELGRETYLPRLNRTSDTNVVSVIRMPRLQSELELLHINISSKHVDTVYHEKSNTYIELNNDLIYLDDGFLITNEKTGYEHIYYYSLDGKLNQQLTKGEWQIDELIGESNGWVYFSSTEVSSIERRIYRVQLDGSGKQELINHEGMNSAELSFGGRFLVNVHSSARQPRVTSLHKNSGALVRVLEENKIVNERLMNTHLSYPEFIQVPSAGKEKLNAYIIKPKGFKPKKKHPVLVYVYGGPGIQTVTNRWGSFDFMWFQTLADKGYIIISVDVRGTGGRGAKFRQQTYGNLGAKEMEDIIQLAHYLKQQRYVNPDRIGIWGWSYGGYLTALALTKGSDHYKVGISVAPVTNWRFYDTIYTERYLGLPKDNADGYDVNSPINFADRLKGKLILVHGTADDNVHFQNQMAFQKELIDAGKQFDSFNYPDKNHGIYGGITRYHIYTMMTSYITKNL